MTRPTQSIVPSSAPPEPPARSRRPTLSGLIHDEHGQDIVEYALILSAMGLGAFALCGNIGTVVQNGLNNIGNSLTSYV